MNNPDHVPDSWIDAPYQQEQDRRFAEEVDPDEVADDPGNPEPWEDEENDI